MTRRCRIVWVVVGVVCAGQQIPAQDVPGQVGRPQVGTYVVADPVAQAREMIEDVEILRTILTREIGWLYAPTAGRAGSSGVRTGLPFDPAQLLDVRREGLSAMNPMAGMGAMGSGMEGMMGGSMGEMSMMYGDPLTSGTRGGATPSRPASRPLGAYLEGAGVVYQLELHALAEPAPADERLDASGCTYLNKSEWERTQMELRGELGRADCRECHMPQPGGKAHDPTATSLDEFRKLHNTTLQQQRERRSASVPTREELVARLLEVLAENGRHVRHLGNDERIMIAVTVLPEQPQAAAGSASAYGDFGGGYGSAYGGEDMGEYYEGIGPAEGVGDPYGPGDGPAGGGSADSSGGADPSSGATAPGSGLPGAAGGPAERGGRFGGRGGFGGSGGRAGASSGRRGISGLGTSAGGPSGSSSSASGGAANPFGGGSSFGGGSFGRGGAAGGFGAGAGSAFGGGLTPDAGSEELAGDLHLRQGQPGEAVAAFERAIWKIFGGERAAPMALPELMRQTRRWTANERRLLEKLVQAYLAAGRIADARKLLENWPPDERAGGASSRSPGSRDSERAVRLPARLVVSATKAQLDAVGSGKLSRDEFRREAHLRYFDPQAKQHEPAAARKIPADLEGVVLDVNDETETVEFSLGADRGLSKGTRLSVRRGDVRIADITVIRVGADRSVARIDVHWDNDQNVDAAVQRGDRVTADAAPADDAASSAGTPDAGDAATPGGSSSTAAPAAPRRK